MKAYLIAGELSGDQLGAHLMDGLIQETDMSFHGIGGPMMIERGLPSLFDMSELSVMGLTEVLPKLVGLLRRIRQTAEDVLAVAPDVLITIDSPDFCLRVAKKVKAVRPDIKVVHYVAPSVWAWRPKRAAKMARYVDHVLALLPFEPPYMERAGMSCDFVGHPVAQLPVIKPDEVNAFRQKFDLAEDAPLLCLLPGSRKGEVSRHGPVLRASLTTLLREMPNLKGVLPVAPTVRDLVQEAFADMDCVTFIDPSSEAEKLAAFAAADVALAVSGTVSLELASQNTPMVIAYDAAPVTKFIMKRAFLLDTATLVNIVSETHAVPEFIFENFSESLIVPELKRLFVQEDARKLQARAAAKTMKALGREGDPPGRRAARSVLNAIR